MSVLKCKYVLQMWNKQWTALKITWGPSTEKKVLVCGVSIFDTMKYWKCWNERIENVSLKEFLLKKVNLFASKEPKKLLEVKRSIKRICPVETVTLSMSTTVL